MTESCKFQPEIYKDDEHIQAVPEEVQHCQVDFRNHHLVIQPATKHMARIYNK